MKETPQYTEFHPRWHRARVSTYWWLERWPYTKFILRELTSVPIAWFVVVTLLQVRALGLGPAAYEEFLSWLKSPLLIAINVVSLCAAVFHAVTWFNLAPKALTVRAAGRRVPDRAVAALNYAAWLLFSGVVAWFLVGG